MDESNPCPTLWGTLHSTVISMPERLESLKALRHRYHRYTCNYTNACFYLVSIHQMAPSQTKVAVI